MSTLQYKVNFLAEYICLDSEFSGYIKAKEFSLS